MPSQVVLKPGSQAILQFSAAIVSQLGVQPHWVLQLAVAFAAQLAVRSVLQ